MNPVVSNGNKLRWKFENVTNLTEDGMFSDKFSIDGVDWKFKIRILTDTVKWLAVFLYGDSDNRNDKNWICEVDAKYKILNRGSDRKHLVQETKHCRKHDSNSLGFSGFVKWDELILTENGYLKDDSVVVEIEIDFKYYDFSKKIPNFTDMIVNVEETDFHVNKWVLCSKSEYFYNLLVNKKIEDAVVHLDDIKATDFGYLLASFNPYFDSALDKNYVELMKIAKIFGVSSLHYKCEQFLITYTKIELIDKIKVADDNGYEILMKSCIESLKSGTDIKNLHGNEKFLELKESTKLRIMQRFLDIY